MINNITETFVIWLVLVLFPLALLGFVIWGYLISILIILGVSEKRIFRKEDLDYSKFSGTHMAIAWALSIYPLVFLLELFIEPSLSIRERIRHAFNPVYI
mgnify:CR=1 FL=1